MMDKVINFVMDHKKEIVVGLTSLVVGGYAHANGSKYSALLKPNKVLLPGFRIDGPLTIGDIGKLGEEFIKHDPVLTKNTKILKVGHFEFE